VFSAWHSTVVRGGWQDVGSRRAARPTQLENDCGQLEAALGPLPAPRGRGALVATVGLPGSGKSYFARRLAGRLPAVLLESDVLRRSLFRNPGHGYKESRRLFRAIHALIDRYLEERRVVVLDATNLREQFRLDLKAIADRRHSPFFLVELEAPEEVIVDRLNGRGTLASEAGLDVYWRFKAEAEPIQLEHQSVASTEDITIAVERIAREIDDNT
jgi:predicted kinase